MSVEMGQDTVLSCDICSNPPATIRWIHEGRNIIDNSRTYTVYNVTQNNTGNYICIVTNVIRDHSVQKHFLFSVHLPGPPHVPGDFHVTSRTSASVCLSWRPGYDGGYKVQFSLLMRQNGESDDELVAPNIPETTSQHCVRGLNQQTTYEFQLVARNKYNGGSESEAASVQASTKG